MDKVSTVAASLGRRLLAALILLLLIIPSSGCRLCANCDDLAYPAYGGSWQRTRRDAGRVGSLFDPAGGRASELVSRDAPEAPDAIERKRQGEKGDGSSILGPPEDGESKTDEGDINLDEKPDDLRDRKLEDIEEEQEEKLRGRTLDEIDVKIVPGQPLPPVLR